MMTQAEKLRQSIDCVIEALGQLAARMEPYHVNAAGEVTGARIDINPTDESGPWREACDMIAQAREEARDIEASVRGGLMEEWAAIAPKIEEAIRRV